MKTSLPLIAANALLGVFVHGCAMPNTTGTTAPCVGGPAANISGFSVNVRDARWTEQATHPSLEKLPQKQRSALSSTMTQTAQSAFLTIDMEIVNATKAPIAWTIYGRYVPNYKLVSVQGVQYESRPDLSSIHAATGLGNLNPGMPARGTVVFDVPKDTYTFFIVQQRPSAPSKYIEVPAFKCAVNA